MFRALLLTITLTFCHLAQAQIVLTDETLNSSFANQAEFIEDADQELSIDDALNLNDTLFKAFTNQVEVLDFNASRWFIKFNLLNKSNDNRLILETARPITNKVILYEVYNKKVVSKLVSGDDFSFDEKSIDNKKNLFLLDLGFNQSTKYILEIESDGEVVNLPLRIWREKDFYADDYQDQFFHGIYYGILLIVIFIFTSFYVLLRERVYLMYVIYVVFQIFLQFCLDGYLFEYIFTNSSYLTDRMVILTAGGSISFVMIYSYYFLRLGKQSLKYAKVFKIIIVGCATVVLFSLLPTSLYPISYPAINLLGLIGTIAILAALSNVKKNGYSVDPFFTLGFILLVLGAVVFILGNFHLLGEYDLSNTSLKISSVLEILALSISMARRFKNFRIEKQEAQRLALEALQEKNALSSEINIRLEKEVKARTLELQAQQIKLEEVNTDLTSSIIYSQRIQQALLPTDEFISELFDDYFIINKPRDIVSGDFYFVESVTTESGIKMKLFAVIDCTGHGVPGAFMSLIGNQYLKQSLKEKHVNSPAEALDFLNRGLQKSLKQNSTEDLAVRDGMDMVFCGYNEHTQKLSFAGAKNSIYVIRDSELPYPDEQYDSHSSDKTKILLEFKGDKHPIGSYGEEQFKPFTDTTINVYPGDVVYLFSDGYMDQFGGPRNKKFGSRSFKKLLLRNAAAQLGDQKLILEQELANWQGKEEQLDDILVAAFKITGERIDH